MSLLTLSSLRVLSVRLCLEELKSLRDSADNPCFFAHSVEARNLRYERCNNGMEAPNTMKPAGTSSSIATEEDSNAQAPGARHSAPHSPVSIPRMYTTRRSAFVKCSQMDFTSCDRNGSHVFQDTASLLSQKGSRLESLHLLLTGDVCVLTRNRLMDDPDLPTIPRFRRTRPLRFPRIRPGRTRSGRRLGFTRKSIPLVGALYPRHLLGRCRSVKRVGRTLSPGREGQ